jgi:hypothetical protein
LKECGLELHPEKTKVVYCKDDDRRRRYPNEKFDFLGYTFRPRRSKNRFGKYFINFSPAVSDKAVKAIRAEIRGWNLHLRSDKSIEDLSRMRLRTCRVQPDHSRVAPVLRAVLPVGTLSADAATGSIIGPMGQSEIQEAAQTFAQGDALGRADLETRSEVVGALAEGCTAWFHGGSRMSGTAQTDARADQGHRRLATRRSAGLFQLSRCAGELSPVAVVSARRDS